MSELIFRQARIEDIPTIFSLSKDLICRYEDLSAIEYEKVISWVERKITDTIDRYTCVFHNGEKVAYYCLQKGEGEWELDDFYVLPPFQNRGIGSKILSECLSQVDAPVFLYVFTQNTGAIRLYERFGFFEVKTVSPTRKILRREG